MKECRKCKQLKIWEAFAKNRSLSDGYDNYCKPCKNEYNKSKKYHLKYYKKNTETVKKRVYKMQTSIKSGVYGLFEKGVCLYVGESKNPYSRMSTHKTWIKNIHTEEKWNPSKNNLYPKLRKHKHIIFGIIEECNNHKEREKYWIDYYQPKYNG